MFLIPLLIIKIHCLECKCLIIFRKKIILIRKIEIRLNDFYEISKLFIKKKFL